MLREYFIGVMLLITLISVALAVVHPRQKSATVFAAGVILICAVMLPIVDIIKGYGGNFNIDEYLNLTEDYQSADMVEAAFEEGIRLYIADEYRVDAGDVTVRVDGFDLSSLRAERIYVTLSGKAALLDYKSIEEELIREFTQDGECEVSVRIG